MQSGITNDIYTTEALRWSWIGVRKGATMGLVLGLISSLAFGPLMLIFGPIFGFIFGLIGAIFGGISRNIIEKKSIPNQGVHLSIRNAILGGLIVGLIFGLIGGLIGSPVLGLYFGLAGVCWYGGLDVLRHYILRSILIREGYIARNYAHFLDYAAKLIFLRKIGGGYVFRHRLLLEHFAAMDLPKKKS